MSPTTATAADTWKVRHEGSPRSVENLTLEQVLEGLQDGQWEPTDEVMGPDQAEWVAIENHPQLAEVAAELEPPPPRTYDDETRLDMNALIDVCLVLLIFFMLITTYSVLQKRLDQPKVSKDDPNMRVVKQKDVEQQMLLVKVSMEGGQPVIRLEGEVVAPENLTSEFSKRTRGTKKTDLLLDAEDEVPHGTVATIQAAATSARMKAVHLVEPGGKK
jgi:biopolymer transport protein ExbD